MPPDRDSVNRPAIVIGAPWACVAPWTPCLGLGASQGRLLGGRRVEQALRTETIGAGREKDVSFPKKHLGTTEKVGLHRQTNLGLNP